MAEIDRNPRLDIETDPLTPKQESFLQGLVNKGLKQIYLEHARKSGASEDWIKKVEQDHVMTVVTAVTVLWGDPPPPSQATMTALQEKIKPSGQD